MSTSTSKDGVADLLSGEAADSERKRLADLGVPALDDAAASAAMGDDEPAKPAATAAATRTRKATRRPKAAAKKAAAKKATTSKKAAARKATPAKKVSVGRSVGANARTVAAEILKRRGGEMAVAELAALVVKSGRTKLAGKTPEATVAAQIYVAARNGSMFRKTTRGHVALLEAKSS